MTNELELPCAEDFFLSVPMYSEYVYSGAQVWDLINLLYFDKTIDCYCPRCGKDATFKGQNDCRPPEYVRNINNEQNLIELGVSPQLPNLQKGCCRVSLCCTRSHYHRHDYFFNLGSRFNEEDEVENFIVKVGQYPSFSDLHLQEIKKYSSVLSKNSYKELARGIGLASHDVGVGAYVYLRRVFEGLIEEAHKDAVTDEIITEEKYRSLRMAERIKMLRDYLPSFLVENPAMYSLLSKGVHELTEAECLNHFDALRVGIELILDEKIEKNKKETKLAKAKAALKSAVEDVY